MRFEWLPGVGWGFSWETIRFEEVSSKAYSAAKMKLVFSNYWSRFARMLVEGADALGWELCSVSGVSRSQSSGRVSACGGKGNVSREEGWEALPGSRQSSTPDVIVVRKALYKGSSAVISINLFEARIAGSFCIVMSGEAAGLGRQSQVVARFAVPARSLP
jgi:hypothetical protein